MEECNYEFADLSAVDPFEEFVKKEEVKRGIYAFLPPLTKRQQQILYLYWADYSKTEIALLLDISEGTVRTTLNRIFDKF